MCCKRQKVNWEQKRRGTSRLPRLPGCAGRGWVLQPSGHSSVGAFSMPWAVEELLLIAAREKGTRCFLECCFLGLCLCFRKLLPSTVTMKVCHPSRVAVSSADVRGTASHLQPQKAGEPAGCPLTPQEMRASGNLK